MTRSNSKRAFLKTSKANPIIFSVSDFKKSFDSPPRCKSISVSIRVDLWSIYSSAKSTGFNFISPAAFFSNCWIFNSAAASFSWQTLTSCAPSSYFAKSVSSGKSSDSMAATMPSSFFKASSNGGFLAETFWFALFCALATAATIE